MNIISTAMPKLLGLMLLWVLACLGSTAQAEDNYSDYLPKYRKFKSHYQIDKIEYREKRTILYFRQIVQETGSILLYGSSHPNAWYLRTPPRMKGLEIQFKMLEMRNVTINNILKVPSLTNVPEMDQEVKRGDIITYELHFVRIPAYIRMIDMIEGENGDLDEDKLNCFDIMIKTKDSPLLGTEENTQAIGEKFNTSFNYANAQRPAAIVIKEEQPSAPAAPALIKEGSEPIDYIPKPLYTMSDIKCKERVILPDVKFRDNEISFAGRVKAVDNIKIIAHYMRIYPQSIVRLHGHTDVLGDEYKNLELSKERAMAVKRELVIMGIDYDRIEIYFYGGRQPLQHLASGGEDNRRVEVEALCISKEEQEKVPKSNIPSVNNTQLIISEKEAK